VIRKDCSSAKIVNSKRELNKQLKPRVNVVICDNHQVVLAGLNLIFSSCDDIKVIGIFQDIVKLEEFIKSNHEIDPHVVVIDAQLGQSGLDVPKLFEGSKRVRWFLLSSFVDKYLVYKSRIKGFSGCISNEVSADFIINAVTNPSDKFITFPHFDDAVTAQFENVYNAISLLTKRELEIINVISTGMSSKKCAEVLHISVLTLETHKKNVFRKFDIKSISELMRIVVDFKLV
jgi:DNA-binding NarL/FixJ family response regulator